MVASSGLNILFFKHDHNHGGLVHTLCLLLKLKKKKIGESVIAYTESFSYAFHITSE